VTDIGANPLGGRTEGANSIGNPEVDLTVLVDRKGLTRRDTHLSGVRLGGDGVGGWESSFLAEDLRIVS
jgi:hypothetical protein